MSYQTMKHTRNEIIFAHNSISIRWHPSNRDHFISLGYEYTGHNTELVCYVSDLLPSSNVLVSVICSVCGYEYNRKYSSVTNSGSTVCRKCCNVVDLFGEIFGRLEVVELDITSVGNGRARWICRCECGVVKSVGTRALISGSSTSCGCYNKEILRSRVGENHPRYKERNEVVCAWCNDTFYVAPCYSRGERKRVYCSDACANEAKRERWTGSNHPAWNDQLTDEQRNDNRDYLEYSLWRTAVYERDGYKCQACGSTKSNDLCAHHLYNYSTYVAYQTEVWNGVTLCNGCHNDFHYNFMGNSRESCTPDDYYDWLEETGANERLIELI